MGKITAVLDTNIWISYFIKNRNEELKQFIFDNDITVYCSNDSVKELNRVLSRAKFKKYLCQPVQSYLLFYLSLAEHFETESIFTACPDEKDNYLFDLAIQSKVKYLVTGE